MIINVGRGDTIVTDDLVKALKEHPKRMVCDYIIIDHRTAWVMPESKYSIGG